MSTVTPIQPTILLDSHADPSVSASLVRLVIKLSKSGQVRGDVELNNWGAKNNTLGYLYFDDPRFSSGKPVQVRMGQQVLLDGQIAEIDPHYPAGTPPTLSLVVLMYQPAESSTPVGPVSRLSYGNELLEFDVKETWLAERGPALSREIRHLSGQGTASFAGHWMPGLKVDLEGLGARYSGAYTLIEVTHTFDKAAGLRTQFAAERIE